jgi:hypothetical protein
MRDARCAMPDSGFGFGIRDEGSGILVRLFVLKTRTIPAAQERRVVDVPAVHRVGDVASRSTSSSIATAPVPGQAGGRYLTTDPGTGITELTYLVISRAGR